MKNKRGISLIVLVITIIVVIILAAAVILTLTSNNPIDSANKATFLNDLSTFNDELNMYKAQQYSITKGQFDQSTLNADFTDTTTLFTYIPSLNGKTKYNDEIAVVSGTLRYVSENSTKKTWAESINISTEKATLIVNAPVLSTGMTPIKWDVSGNVVTTTSTDSSWYNYESKQWANARTTDGSMWVWIPRYEYKIPTPHSSTAQTIDVNFIPITQTTPTSGYIVHPAFTFGSTQLAGIWVAKFEASGSASSIEVKPEVISLRQLSINDMFTACLSMATNTAKYGWSTTNLDTHLIKNVEWGAAAYLTQSIYGKNSEVWMNPDSSFKTGRAGTGVNSAAVATTSTYAYNNVTYGVQTSTTGNVYGIYDMNGCTYELVAGYLANGNSSLTTNGNSLYTAGNQYKDVYTSNGDVATANYLANSSKVGDAVYETSPSVDSPNTNSWFTDYSYMPFSTYPFFLRGGLYSYGINGGMFSFSGDDGVADFYTGFRPVVVLGSGI